MNYLKCFLIYVMLTNSLFAQTILSDSVEVRENSMLFVDGISEVFVVHQAELIKYNSSLQKISENSNLAYGDITSLDATNPLKVLVFIQGNSTILVLDNKLAAQGKEIDLLSWELENVSVICRSVNNAIWLYNPLNSELVRMTEGGQELVKTGNLAQILSLDDEIIWMTEKDDNLYTYMENYGVLIFDIYGTLLRKVDVPKNITPIGIQENKFVYNVKDKLYFRSLEFPFSETEIILPSYYEKLVLSQKDLFGIKNNMLFKFVL